MTFMNKKLNILILGGGGREHALSWKIAQSPRAGKLYIAPGNSGTARTGENVDLDPSRFDDICRFTESNNIDMLVVGPEAPLVEGIHDHFLASDACKRVAVTGPSKNGAMLEGSKDFAKAFMNRHNIPTANHRSFTSDTIREGMDFLKNMRPPYVLKADGLAAGKGVVICHTMEEAKDELNAMIRDKKFGPASEKVVIEEFLDGIELSVFILTDGHSYVILPEAKDYKRIGEGDTGLNTGGMGSISPVPFAGDVFMQKVNKRIINPTVQGLRKEGITYKGFLFFGLMNVHGDPYVIEYNVRMGDPEAESIIPRIKTDLVDLLQATAEGKLKGQNVEIDPRTSAAVFLVSGGYPGSYEKGLEITGLDDVQDALLFHAGSKLVEGTCHTSGGRVIAVTCLAETLEKALSGCYRNAEKIRFDKKYYRKDLGHDLATYT